MQFTTAPLIKISQRDEWYLHGTHDECEGWCSCGNEERGTEECASQINRCGNLYVAPMPWCFRHPWTAPIVAPPGASDGDQES
jgi:hypothetical protein